MAEYFPNLYSNLEWEKKINLDLEAGTDGTGLDRILTPIQPILYDLTEAQQLVIVGIGSADAKQKWVTGGWVSLHLPFVPDYTTQFNYSTGIDGGVDSPQQQTKIKLGKLKMIRFP